MKAKITLRPDSGTFYFSTITDAGKTIYTGEQTGRKREFDKTVLELQSTEGFTVTKEDDYNYLIEEVTVAKVAEPVKETKPAE